jgi:addiction module RelB/DinJ family antitoxin
LTGQTCQPSAESDSKPILKHDAEKVFRESGLTATQAITLCWKQVEIEGALPFAVRMPNDVTIGAEAAEAPPESASGSRLGACAERSVGTPASLPPSVSQELMLQNHI